MTLFHTGTTTPPTDPSFCILDTGISAFLVDAQDAGLVHGQRIAYAGVYDVVLTATLDDGFYSPVTINSIQTFELNMVNPCETAVVNDPSVADEVLDRTITTSVKRATAEEFYFYRV